MVLCLYEKARQGPLIGYQRVDGERFNGDTGDKTGPATRREMVPDTVSFLNT